MKLRRGWATKAVIGFLAVFVFGYVLQVYRSVKPTMKEVKQVSELFPNAARIQVRYQHHSLHLHLPACLSACLYVCLVVWLPVWMAGC